MDGTDATADTTTTGRPAAASTSWTPPATSPSADPVTALGERILAELRADRTNQTLTRWLAHHTAGLIQAAEEAREAGAPDAEARTIEARTAILHLWDHRSAWPSGWPPRRAAEIVRVLDGLPALDDPGWSRTGGVLGRLQDLHHHVLGLLTDLAAARTSLEEGWLRTFGDRLTPDEAVLLTRAASVDRRLDVLFGDDASIERLQRRLAHAVGESGAEPDERGIGDDGADDGGGEPGSDDTDALVTHPLVQLADAYRDVVIAVVREATRDRPTDVAAAAAENVDSSA